MTTKYSISVNDWQNDKWNFVGRNIEEETRGEWSEDNEEGVGADDYYPIMLYAYPLQGCPDEKTIREMHEKTACTVVEDTETGDHFLALCGGGMDLSQDVAMAYLLADGFMPAALAEAVSTQEGLSQRGSDWLKVMRYCKKVMLNGASAYRERAKEITRKIEEYKGKKRGS